MSAERHYPRDEGLGRRGALQVLGYFALRGFSATAVGIGFGKMIAWANVNRDAASKSDNKKVEKVEDDGEGKKCKLKGNYPEDVARWCDQIFTHAKNNNISADLVAVIIWGESEGNPQVISASGAVGLMQVLSSDGEAAKWGFTGRPTVEWLKNPDNNIKYGTGYLGGLIAKYGIFDGIKSYGPPAKYLQDEYGDPDYYVKGILSVWEKVATKDYGKYKNEIYKNDNN